MAAVAAGCSDAVDSEGSGERGAYVEVFEEVAAASDPTASDDEARCIAEATVDTVGVERLGDALRPEEVRERRSIRPPDLGIEVGEQDADTFYEQLGDCMDLREYLADASAGPEDGVGTEVQRCVHDNLDDDLVRRIVVDSFQNPDDARDPSVSSDLEEIFRTCAGT